MRYALNHSHHHVCMFLRLSQLWVVGRARVVDVSVSRACCSDLSAKTLFVASRDGHVSHLGSEGGTFPAYINWQQRACE